MINIKKNNAKKFCLKALCGWEHIGKVWRQTWAFSAPGSVHRWPLLIIVHRGGGGWEDLHVVVYMCKGITYLLIFK